MKCQKEIENNLESYRYEFEVSKIELFLMLKDVAIPRKSVLNPPYIITTTIKIQNI